MDFVGAVYSEGKAKKRRQGPAQAGSARGHEWHHLDLVFRLPLVPAVQGVSPPARPVTAIFSSRSEQG